MRASSPGSLTFSANPADVPIANDVIVFGSADPVSSDDILYGSATLEIQGSQDAQPDLVAFAKALADANVELWTTTLDARGRVAEQLDLFEEGQHFLPINELLQPVGDDSESDDALEPTQAATDAGRVAHNVWVFPDGTETTGELLTLEEISTRSGVAIPTSVNPSIVPLDDVTVLNGAPLHIALDGYDPNGDVLTYSISVENNDALEATLLDGNRSIRFENTEDGIYLGDTVFELFEGRASRATDRMIELALDGFYEGITYHRVVDGFVIQAGDPTGTGTSGSDLGDFDDQFHVDLQHTSPGILSMAKTDDDTNDSQFFVTEGTPRHLDFNHTIFGLLTEGARVRETMSNVSVTDSSPVIPLVIEGAQIFEDTQNAVVMLRGLESTGTTTVTVTATDVNGNSTTETFEVTLDEDTEDGTPFLLDFEDPVFEVDEPIEFSVDAVDVEGDTINYRAFIDNNVQQDATIEIDEEGNVTASGFVGTVDALIQVSSSTGFPASLTDGQFFEITAKTDGPTSIDLVATSDTGVLDDDNVTNLTELEFEVSGLIDGAPIVIFANDIEIGRGNATGETSTITVTTTVIGQQDITAAIDLGDELSSRSPRLPIEVDQTPPAVISNEADAPTTADVGEEYTFDAEHENERSVGYSLENAPEGMTIVELTGEVSWVPTGSQAGTQTFQIVVSDVAGNTSSADVSVEVSAGTVEVSLNAVSTDGTPLASVTPGTEFSLEVFVEDQRANPTGVQQFSFDLIVDPARATVDAAGVDISDDFDIDATAGTITTTGVTDFGGTTDAQLGDTRVLVATIPVIAGSPGILNASIVSDLIVLSDNTSIPLADVEIVGATVGIVATGEEFTAVDDQFTIDEDADTRVFEVLENDILAADSQIVSITALTNPSADGTAEISDNGRTITYTPAADVNGEEAFRYQITDGEGRTSDAIVTVTIRPVNDPPRAIDRNYPADLPEEDRNRALITLVEDNGGEVIFRLQGDEIVDAEDLAAIVDATSPNSPTIRPIFGEGELDANLILGLGYTPAPNFSGEDVITYTIQELALEDILTGPTDGLTDTGTLTVRVARVNDAPSARSNAFQVVPGQAFTIQPEELLDNDSAGPLEDAEQTIRLIGVAGGEQGSVTLNDDGSITYTPSANASGRDEFTYTIEDDGTTESIVDGQLVSSDDPLRSSGTVRIVFTDAPTNDPPNATNDSRTVVNNGDVVSINALRNDSDDGGSTGLSITEFTQGQNGTVEIVDGQLQYTPDATFFGSDTFTYTIFDGRFSDTASVTVELLDPTITTNSQFSGVVFQDIDGDGIQTGDEPGYASVLVRLSGTDIEGNEVDRVTSTDVNGNYKFDSLSHGTYEVSQEQPLLLLDGIESASAESSVVADDTLAVEISEGVIVSENNTFAEVGVSPRFAMLELLSSRRGDNGFLVAIGESGSSQFVGTTTGWDGFTSIRVESAAGEVTVIAVDENGQEMRATVSATDRNFVQQIGRDSDTNTTLLRITTTAEAFDFVAV